MMRGVNYFQKLYYHRLGTAQSEDAFVYGNPEQKEYSFGGEVTEDGRYLIIGVGQGTDVKNRVYFKDLTAKNAQVVKLLDDFDASYDFIGNDGTLLLFQDRSQFNARQNHCYRHTKA